MYMIYLSITVCCGSKHYDITYLFWASRHRVAPPAPISTAPPRPPGRIIYFVCFG